MPKEYLTNKATILALEKFFATHRAKDIDEKHPGVYEGESRQIKFLLSKGTLTEHRAEDYLKRVGFKKTVKWSKTK